MNELNITYSTAKYDGTLNISKTMAVAKVEWIENLLSKKVETKMLLDNLSEEDRLDIFDDYCLGCGTNILPCNCMRDD